MAKDPNRICGYDWGGIPGLEEYAWGCPHVCRLTVAEHGETERRRLK